MKKLEEIGISPTPWKLKSLEDEFSCAIVETDDGETHACATNNDARLIAAAPKLYECLREAVEHYKCETRSCDKCPNGKCWIVDATAALAEAAGEEAKE